MSVFVSLALRLLAVVLRLIQLTVTTLMSLWYRAPPQTIPTLQNSLLIISATELAQRIRDRKVTSTEVVKVFIDRIEQVNPVLNCVVDNRFKQALDEAAQVDKLIADTSKTKAQLEEETPLLGVPFTTKDAIMVTGMRNTAGLWVRREKRAEQDAQVVALLRKAGAIPLALTNVPELCMWWESSNHVHGTTCNPYDTRRMPGGSTGGEGSLLAAAGSPFGIGSDIGGSIRIPCVFNGIYGHKASTGVIPLEGHYPVPEEEIQKAYQSIGPMSRYPQDLNTVLKIIGSPELKLHQPVDITKLKYYYMDDDGGSPIVSPVDPELKKAFQKTVDYFKRAHGITVQKVNLTKLRNSTAMFLAKFTTKLGPLMPEEMADGQGKANLWLEFARVTARVSKHTLACVLFAIMESLLPAYGTPIHKSFVTLCDELRTELEDMLGDDGVFLYPTHPTPALYHNESLVRPFNFVYTGIFNVTGLPATACPLGLTSKGLPIGTQVVASRNMDRLTLAVAAELEKAFGGWVPPPTHGNAALKRTAMKR